MALPRSPRILSLTWGEMVVDDVGVVRDAKLWPGGGRAWDWNETGTHHHPGIQPADVEELLAHEATVLVLIRGHDEELETMPETLALLAERGVVAHVADTPAAVTRYNELADAGEPVGGLFHSTC